RDDLRAMSIFAGRANTSNIDAVSQKFVRDTNDVFVGGSFDIVGFDAVQIGLYGVYITPTEKILGQRSHSITGGLTVALPSIVDWLSLYFEGDFQRREILGLEEDGYAAYGTADVHFGGLSFLLEGLFISKFQQRGSQNTSLGQSFTYNQPPTLTRIDQEISNNRDVAGGRLKVEY